MAARSAGLGGAPPPRACSSKAARDAGESRRCASRLDASARAESRVGHTKVMLATPFHGERGPPGPSQDVHRARRDGASHDLHLLDESCEAPVGGVPRFVGVTTIELVPRQQTAFRAQRRQRREWPGVGAGGPPVDRQQWETRPLAERSPDNAAARHHHVARLPWNLLVRSRGGADPEGETRCCQKLASIHFAVPQSCRVRHVSREPAWVRASAPSVGGTCARAPFPLNDGLRSLRGAECTWTAAVRASTVWWRGVHSFVTSPR
jgi:hypothetical protein